MQHSKFHYKIISKKNYFLIVFLLVGLLFLSVPVQAKVSDWQRSASIMSRGPDDFGSETFRQSVNELKKLSPTHVTLIITLYQHDSQSTALYAGPDTPTDAALISGIQYIHSLGIKTHLKFHVETDNHAWRAYINPPEAERAQWYASYTDQLKKYAVIAEKNKVDILTLGAELTNMTTADAHTKNTERWTTLITQVREVFSGKLTYCANSSTTINDWTNEKERIAFWPQLDYVGISVYHGLTTSNPTVESFKSKWDLLNKNNFLPLQQKINKPLVFCEIGYRNVSFAQNQLYDFWTQGESNEQRQADLYEALFSYWDDKPYLAGVHLWNWSSDPAVGGPTNTDYTPHGKKAEETITAWWKNGTQTPPPITPQMKLTARIAQKTVAAGEAVMMYAVVENMQATQQNGLIIDMEVYDKSGQKVFQKIHENKTFSPLQAKTYEAIWTPTITGEYEIKMGVFSAGWSQVYTWINNAATLSVSGTTPAPQNLADMQVWWPTDAAVVSGVQPIKGIIANWSASEYTMYWRVDRGVWNTMSQASPHKESHIDVSGWKWNSTNIYTIDVLAKDLTGQEIGMKTVRIQVVN